MSNAFKLRAPDGRLAYIASLGLAAPRDLPASELRLVAETQSANAVAGSTVSFVTGFPMLQKPTY